MVYRTKSLVLLGAGAVLAFAATGSWQTKDFSAWTKDDVQEVMTDSPWAKQMPMPAAGRPQITYLDSHGDSNNAQPSAALGNPSNTTTGQNMSASGGPGANGPADPNGLHQTARAPMQSGMSGPVGAPESAGTLSIIWASATPVRLAVLKIRHGSDTVTEKEMSDATRPRENYVIAVAGLPAPEYNGDVRKLASKASLTVKNKPSLPANDAYYRVIGDSNVYFFRFPKASYPIDVSDQQVEFKVVVGNIEVKRKFDLKDMQYQNQLAL